MTPKIETVQISKLRPNPYRNLSTYPWNEDKIEALLKSYQDIGVFMGIIVRPMPDGTFEKWFGHHRQEAAERKGMKTLDVIVQDASDMQMIKAMAHENGEDYASDFVIQLNTWEGGIQFLRGQAAENPQPLEIARLLGMTCPDELGKHGDRLDMTAEACSAAHSLIVAGHLDRKDLIGLNVKTARELTGALVSQMKLVDNMAKISKAPATSVTKAKGFVAKAGKVAAERSRRGEVSTKGIRMEVSSNAFSELAKARKSETQLPLLTAFADALCRSLAKTLHDDYAAEKLSQIARAVASIVMEEDHAAVRRVQFELEEVAKRATKWGKRITPNREKVVSLTKLEDKR